MVLKVSGIVKIFGRGAEVAFALRVDELVLTKGELTFLMGHNGSGKSVLARLVSREIEVSPPHTLRIMVDGTGELVARAGILRQNVDENLAGDLTVLENLAIRSSDLSLGERLRPRLAAGRLVSSLSRFPLVHEKRDHITRSLSLGQRQALAFSVVASRRYPLLFLDEFLSATDASTSHLLRTEARRYAVETPAAVCIISHDLPLALSYADCIIVMRNGLVAGSYRPSDPEWSESRLLPLLSASLTPP